MGLDPTAKNSVTGNGVTDPSGAVRGSPRFTSWSEFLDHCDSIIKRRLNDPRCDYDRIRSGFLSGRLETGNRETNLQQPAILFPDLPSSPWPAKSAFGWVATIESAFKAIRSELDGVVGSGHFRPHPEVDKLASRGSWEEFRFYSKGQANQTHLSLCPETDRCLQQIPGATTAGSVFFAAAAANTHIVPHCGPHNLRIRAHLGLIIPNDCEMRVGTERRPWIEGQVSIFDDSFEHEVWNRSLETRIVLLFDTWHPQLTTHEIEAFTIIDSELAKISPDYATIGKFPQF